MSECKVVKKGGDIRKIILVFSCLLFVVSSSLFSDGQVFWTENGVAVGSATSGGPAIVSDMKGGAIVSYSDWRNPGEGIYAQRVDYDGNVLWSDGGEPVWLSDWVTHSPGDVVAVSDGRGGAVIVWVEWSADSYYDIYAGKSERIAVFDIFTGSVQAKTQVEIINVIQGNIKTGRII